MDPGIGVLGSWLADFSALVLLFSGVVKATAVRQFQRQVRSMGVMNAALSDAFGALLPTVEVAVGLLIIARVALVAALSGGLVLMAVFTGFVIWTLATGRRLSCFCFGEKASKVTGLTLARNLIFVAVFGLALFWAAAAGSVVDRFDPARLWSIGYALSGVLVFLSVFQLASLKSSYPQLLR